MRSRGHKPLASLDLVVHIVARKRSRHRLQRCQCRDPRGGMSYMASASRVTIGDVADRAGVSIATVSRVVNGRYGVSTATFERVRAVIDETGYESSLVARSRRRQRTHLSR